MKQYGFTLIEIVITITVMTILLALGVAGMTTAQVNSRDSERASDIATIANHMETFYKTGINSSTVLGRYPSTALLASAETSVKAFFPSINLDSVTAPDVASVAASFIPATNNVQTVAGVLPNPTIDQYVYQPIQTDGTLCTAETQECRKYTLYYRSEIDGTVKKVVSKHQ